MKRDHVKSALAYARDVVAGRVPACRYVKLACQRQLDDLKRWGRGKKPKAGKPYFFDVEAANRVCNFIELLPHTKGKWAAKAERIRLERWQQFGLTTMFGWRRANGTRRFRKGYEEVPRKNGKSIKMAGVGLYMFVADDEFGAEVYSGATTEKQAWEVFRPAHLMVKRTPDLRDAFGIQVNASNLCVLENGSRFEPVIGKPGDGSSPSCAIHDEFHEHDSSDQVDSMETGMGAREQPLQLLITTAGSNLAGPCYQFRNYVIEVLEGRIQDDELFGVIYTIDADDDWTSLHALKKANPNYGVSVSEEFLLARQREAMQSAARQNAFKTKHLNLWVGAKNSWMNMRAWGACPHALPLEELVGRPCYAALDLAAKVDIAAKVLLFPPDGDDDLWHVHPVFWLPEDMVEQGASTNASHYAAWAKQGFIELTPGPVIDFDIIEEAIEVLPGMYEVLEVPYDPWNATQLATSLLKKRVPMVEVPQTVKNFSEPMKKLEALVFEKKLAHPHNPVLDWMMSNVVAKLDKKDNIFPNKESPDKKIDGVVATIMAINRAMVGGNARKVIRQGFVNLE